MIFIKKTLIRLLSLILCGILLLGCVMACDQTDDPAETETGTQETPAEGESTSATTEPESETESETESDTTEETTEETAEEEEPEEETKAFASDFYAGYAITDITPKTSVPLGGYGNTSNRMSKFVGHPIYATCIAVKSGDDIALLYNLDIIRIDAKFVGFVQERIFELTGIPAENVLINCSHTHSAPDSTSTGQPSISAWRTVLLAKLSNLATQAIADLDRSEVYTGSTEVEGMNFVRRYVLADGTHKTNASSSDKIVKHETDADNALQIILFKRQNKQQIALVNWRAHPCITGGYTTPIISGDYISEFRMQMEEKGYLFAFHQGASGNVNTFSAITGESNNNHKKNGKWYSSVLVEAFIEALPTLELTNTDGLYAGRYTLDMKINHETDHMVDKAKEIYAIWSNPSNPNHQKEANELCKKYGISSYYAAGAIITRSQMGESQEITVYALSFGDVAFATAPFEIFQETGRYIKANSPCKMTFASGYTNGSFGYLPAEHAFPYGSYEVDTCKYARGSAEELADALLELLKQQDEARNGAN